MYYCDLHELKNIKYRYTCTCMLLFHTIQLKQRICFSTFMYRSIGEGIQRTHPPPPFEKNVVEFMKEIKKYIHVVKTKHTL